MNRPKNNASRADWIAYADAVEKMADAKAAELDAARGEVARARQLMEGPTRSQIVVAPINSVGAQPPPSTDTPAGVYASSWRLIDTLPGRPIGFAVWSREVRVLEAEPVVDPGELVGPS